MKMMKQVSIKTCDDDDEICCEIVVECVLLNSQLNKNASTFTFLFLAGCDLFGGGGISGVRGGI